MKYSGQNSPASIATDNAAKIAAPAKLSDTQVFVLNAAADHPQGRVEAFPDSVKGGARTKVIDGLTARGWIKSVGAHLKITKAGFAAIGRDKPVAKVELSDAATNSTEKVAKAPRAPKADKPIKVKAPSKQDLMTELMSREGGVAIGELITATGWQPHSVRGALSTLNKHLGGTIHSAKCDGQRVYWIGQAAQANDTAAANETTETDESMAA